MEAIIFIVITVLTIIPLYKLLPHFGLNALWAIAAVVPLGVLVLIWVMALRVDRTEDKA